MLKILFSKKQRRNLKQLQNDFFDGLEFEDADGVTYNMQNFKSGDIVWLCSGNLLSKVKITL